jgi:hypothetical protein
VLTHAFSRPGDKDRKVAIWCEPLAIHIHPETHEEVYGYWVINGHWIYRPEIDGGELLWSGVAPFSHHDRHYNDAITWIQEQVDAPPY